MKLQKGHIVHSGSVTHLQGTEPERELAAAVKSVVYCKIFFRFSAANLKSEYQASRTPIFPEDTRKEMHKHNP